MDNDRTLPEAYAQYATEALRPQQHRFRFPNGFGASVVWHENSYGGSEGLFELAVLDRAGKLTYATPITGDVIGWLDDENLERVLGDIPALPEGGDS